MDEWLIIHTPERSFCWPLGQPTDEERDRYVNAARVLTGFPADNDWVHNMAESGRSVILTFGQPHEKLLAVAAVGTLADLQAVPDTDVAAYAATLAETSRQAQIAGAEAALAALHPDDQAAVLAAAAKATP